MKGIYGYFDRQKQEIVYIGKDSNIDKDARHKAHMAKCNKDKQVINRILQNNPQRYEYSVIYICPPHLDDIDLNGLEMQYIEAVNPRHCYTKGGDGNGQYWAGKNRSIETKQKISNSIKALWNDPNSAYYSKEFCQKCTEARRGKPLSEEHKRKISEAKRGQKPSKQACMHQSKAKTTTGIYRVSKNKNKNYKQGFRWRYQWYEGNKKKAIISTSLSKLERKVRDLGLEWIIINQELANKSYEE